MMFVMLLQFILADALQTRDAEVGLDDISFEEDLPAEEGGVVDQVQRVAYVALLQLNSDAGGLVGAGRFCCDGNVGAGGEGGLETAGRRGHIAAHDVAVNPHAFVADMSLRLIDAECFRDVGTAILSVAEVLHCPDAAGIDLQRDTAASRDRPAGS